MPLPVIIMGQANRFAPGHPELEALRKARNKWDDIKSDSKLREALEAYLGAISPATKKFFDFFGLPGVSLIGLPGFEWDSLLDVTREIGGCKKTGELTRIGETNTFVRQVSVAQHPYREDYGLRVPEFVVLKHLTRTPLAVTLPGPYTLAKYTKIPKEKFWELAREYAEILNAEVRELQETGVAMVRIDEFELPDYPGELNEAFLALHALTAQTNLLKLGLSLGSAKLHEGFSERLFALPFGTFFLDFVKRDESLALLPQFPKHKRLVAGIMDGEQSYIESNLELEAITLAIREHVPAENLALSLNTGLQFLPWDAARKKIERLISFAAQVDLSKPSSVEQSNRFIPAPTILDRPQNQWSSIEVGEAEVRKTRELYFPQRAFTVSSVGSFPQTDELRNLRFKFENHVFGQEQYTEGVLELTRGVIENQEKLDFDLAVSGELFRSDMAAFFAPPLGGSHRRENRIWSFDNRSYPVATYDKKIEPAGNGFLRDEMRLIRPLTNLPLKVTITGPATLAAWALREDPDYYHDPTRFRLDFAERLANEIQLLIDDGVRIIQIDEPAITTSMADFPADLMALERCIAPFANRAYFILHICYSRPEKLGEAFPYILELPVHQVHMEFANRGMAFLPLARMIAESGKDIGLGVIDVHNNRIESPNEIVGMCEAVIPFFGKNGKRIHLLPDCGQKDEKWSIVDLKNKNMVLAAEALRKKYGS